LQQSTVNSAESIFCKNGGPLKLAALCGRIARIVQKPALRLATIHNVTDDDRCRWMQHCRI